MGINFPPSPTIGTLWPNPAVAGVPQYTWNGTVWTTVLAPPAFYAQDTAPVGAPVNALWWDTDSGILFINYKDISTTQWVATSSVPAVDTSNFATNESRLRNRIVNGAMQISQEYGNTLHGPTATVNFYPADQWLCIGTSSPGTASAQRVQVRTPKGSTDRIRIVVAAAKTTLTAGDLLYISQPIEGYNIADFLYGTAQAKQAIIRFGFKAPAGTYSVALRNGTSARSYIANFVITAGQANTDTEQVIVVPGDTTGTWANDAASGITLTITMAVGSNFHGTVGWQSGNLIGTSATSNGIAATNNTFELFDVGLYLDTDNVGVPPKWELPAYDDELKRCMRYFQWVPINAYWQAANASEGAGYPILFRMPMRISPTSSAITSDATVGQSQANVNGYALQSLSKDGAELWLVSGSIGLTYMRGYRFSASARM